MNTTGTIKTLVGRLSGLLAFAGWGDSPPRTPKEIEVKGMPKASRKRRALLSTISATLLTLVTLALGTTPANAADMQIVKIGSSTSVGAYNLQWTEYGKTYSVAVIAKFAQHTTNSVRLDSFRVCNGYLGSRTTTWVYPILYRQSGPTPPQQPHKDVPSAGCNTWYVGKVYTKQPDGEVIRITLNISSAGNQIVIASFKR